MSHLFAGSRRGIGVNEEQDQTLNQLLAVLFLLQLFLLLLLKHCMSHVSAGSRRGIGVNEERDHLLLPMQSMSHLFAGSRRGIGVNEERDQTLNQLLTELDGFEGREGVLLLAATNRAEVSTITHTSPCLHVFEGLFV